MKVFIDRQLESDIKNFVIYFEDNENLYPYVNCHKMSDLFVLLRDIGVTGRITATEDSEQTPSLLLW